MHWKEMQPALPYTLFMRHTPTPEQLQTIQLLYQPLIGIGAAGLYTMLAAEIALQPRRQTEGIHQYWMTQTGSGLDTLFEERKKLEGLGLLKVYEPQEQSRLLYELKAPLSPHAFFDDEMLSVFLYNRLGSKERYRQLRGLFAGSSEDTAGMKEKTRTFVDVFTSVHPSEVESRSDEMKEITAASIPLVGPAASASMDLGSSSTASDALALLPPFIEQKDLQRPGQLEQLEATAFLYGFDAEELASLIQDAMLHEDTLDTEKLRVAAKRRYRLKEEGQPPMLGMRKQPPQLRTVEQPKSKEEEQIQYFETTSPVEYLHYLHDGAKIYEGDVQILESLIHEYKLSPGVVNVLIDYLFMTNNGNLVKNLAFKIANHWKRQGVETVPGAMRLAKEEHTKRAQSKQKQAPKKQEEPLPKWMKQQAEAAEPNSSPAQKTGDGLSDTEKAQADAEEEKFLQQLRKKRHQKG
ncbi:replication initiation and membrane attachment family protein [Alkalicoccus chagannorensis]|uniref:replication initiation and membrane attachment family protein n=1 Tax=Alkalicoccus chagannorensis TaxID=427072 RepID=UPI00041393A2|nr:DnaD domain protein [Alkalicoccus chagannorensis]